MNNHQGLPLKHQPTKTMPLKVFYSFNSILKLVSIAKNLHCKAFAPKIGRRVQISQLWDEGNQVMCMRILAQAIFPYMMHSSLMEFITLLTCHCVWLRTILLHSIQIVHKVMP